MTWSDGQRAEIALEYARIGYRAGELWPAPPERLSPAELVALFRRIPDDGGRAGYMAELAKLAP